MQEPSLDRAQIQSTAGSRKVTVNTSAGLFVEANSARTCLLFSPGPTNRITLSLDPAVADGVGLVIYPALGPVRLSLGDLGELVRKTWYAISATAAQDIVVFETQSGSP